MAGEAQAHLNYAPRTLSRKDKVPGPLSVTPHVRQRLSSRPLLLFFLSTWLVSIFLIPLR